MLLVGIDWAEAEHAACLQDPLGGVQQRLEIPHSPGGLVGRAGGHASRGWIPHSVPSLASSRRGASLFQRELAKRADIARETLSRLERGRPASPETIRRLAAALSVPPSRLTDTLAPSHSDRHRSAMPCPDRSTADASPACRGTSWRSGPALHAQPSPGWKRDVPTREDHRGAPDRPAGQRQRELANSW
jgi:DNA-binding XRE family transcriptional regulator